MYHEKKILIPAMVDEFTGYRYYDDENIDRARVVKTLKGFGFSLARIKEMLNKYTADADIIGFLQQQQDDLKEKIREQQQILESIEQVINMEQSRAKLNGLEFEVELKQVDTLLIAAYHMTGEYHEVGKGFAHIGRHFGRQITGKPITLYHEQGHKEGDAEFEACFPIRKGTDKAGIQVRELPGGRCAVLIHKGPFHRVGRAYQKLFAYIREAGLTPKLPYREQYLKGPGMVFRGNPENFLTELMIPVNIN